MKDLIIRERSTKLGLNSCKRGSGKNLGFNALNGISFQASFLAYEWCSHFMRFKNGPDAWFNATCNHPPPGNSRDKSGPSGQWVGNSPKRSCPGGRGWGKSKIVRAKHVSCVRTCRFIW